MLRPAASDTPRRGVRCQSREIPLSTAPLFSLLPSTAPLIQPGFCLQQAHFGHRNHRSGMDVLDMYEMQDRGPSKETATMKR